jgi:hypothetical protein
MHNKITAVAKQGLTVTKGGRTVNIVKGDSFELHGKIVALHGVIIDITEFPNVFQITEHQDELASIVHYKFLRSVAITTGSKTATFAKDSGFSTAGDIVCIHGVILDIAQYADILTVVPTSDDYIEIAGAGVATVSIINVAGSVMELGMKTGIAHYTGDIVNFGLNELTGLRAAIKTMVAETPAYVGIMELLQIDFSKCTAMTKVLDGAFYGCAALTAVNLPANITEIDDYAFYGCQALAAISLPTGLTTIGAHAFENTGFASITLPTAVEVIGDFAFAGCESLTELALSASLTTICDGAFMECSSLAQVTIPANVTGIGGEAFSECSALAVITFLGTTPPELGTDAIPATVEHIYVPADAVDAYKAAYADFAEIIEAAE